MKKLVNLIALVMLVSTNVLTPFSYAEVENPEVIPENEVETVEESLGEVEEIPEINEETPELVSEEKGELEQENQEDVAPENVLPNAQNDVETPTTDETEEVDTESEEVAQLLEKTSGNEVQDEGEIFEELERVEEAVVMAVISDTAVTLLPGQQFNQTIKRLAGQDNAVYYTTNTGITQIIGTGAIPTGVITGEISAEGEEYPVYAWFTGGVLYYTTQAKTIYLNPDSSYMFYYMQGLTGLDLNNRDTSHVINMKYMFYQSIKLEKLDINSWDTANVEDMSYMFSYCSSLTGLDLSNWDTVRVRNMFELFRYSYNIEELNLSGWKFIDTNWMNLLPNAKRINMTNAEFSGSLYMAFYWLSNLEEVNFKGVDTSKVTDMGRLFMSCNRLTGLDLSSFDTSNVKNMNEIFMYCSNLEDVNLSGWDFRKVNNGELARNMRLHADMRSDPQIKKINLTNAKFSGSMYKAFYDLGSLEEIKLDGVDTSNVTNMSYMFSYCKKLTGLDLSSFDISNVTSMSYMFMSCNNLEDVNLSGWDTSNVTYMDYMFEYCNSLTGLNLSKFDTSKTSNIVGMFYGCSGLQNLDLSNWNTSNVTSMGSIFYGCNNLEEINLSGWDFRNTSNASLMMNMTAGGIPALKKLNMANTKYTGSATYAFGGLTKLEELKLDGADTKGVTNMHQMFQNCSNLTKIDLNDIDTSNVTGMSYMFYGCSSLTGLDLSSFDTNKVITVDNMVGSCSSLSELSLSGWDFSNINNASLLNRIGGSLLPLKKLNMANTIFSGNMGAAFLNFGGTEINFKGADTSNVTNMGAMFQNCTNLTGLDLSNFDTSKVTNMQSMFLSCFNLKSLDLSNFDTSNVVSMGNMFNMCTNLENLNLDNWIISESSSTIGSMFYYDNNLKTVSMKNWTIPETFQNAIRASSLSAGLDSIDVSNWNFSGTKDLYGLFGNLKAKEIKGLDTWDTSEIINMRGMFFDCSNLTGLDLSNWNTSNVTNMSEMFQQCSNLTGLDLSNFDISNVASMGNMFKDCSKLENLNLSGLDFRNINNASLMMSLMGGTPQSLKKLNMTNTKYTGNATYVFGGLDKLEELNLEGADTSNVTSMNAMFNGDSNLRILDLGGLDTSNVKDMSAMFYNCSSLEKLTLSSFDTSNVTSMGAMFYGCSGLNELDLTNFNTPKVTAMGQMFFNTPNLKTIYASEKFVTTALSGDTSSKDMFSGTTSVVGGNGTKFDSGYTDKTYALIDKVGQTGYFTDKNAITVKFINTLDGTETLATFAKGQKLTPPYVDKYHVVGGYLDEEMKQAIDLNKGVDSYSVIYVKYERNGSSGGGGGGGGGGGATKPDTPKEEQKPAESPQSDVSTGTTVKEPESSTGNKAEIQTGSQVDSPEEIPQNDDSVSSGANAKDPENTTPMDSSILSQNDEKTYSTEFQQAYKFAHENGITTKDTIQSAQMNGKLTRIAMAKMLSQYAINVLGKEPDVSKGVVKFNDVTSKKDADYDNGVTLAYQLGIMGQNMPGNNFRPNDEVTRAEFATALSRMAYGTLDGEYEATSKYYIHHMEKLVKEGIITKDDPNMKELRGYVMIMLMRSAK